MLKLNSQNWLFRKKKNYLSKLMYMYVYTCFLCTYVKESEEEEVKKKSVIIRWKHLLKLCEAGWFLAVMEEIICDKYMYFFVVLGIGEEEH